MTEHHTLFGGKLHVYRRERSSKWQCAAYVDGKNWRVSTKEESLAHAKDVAEDWYLGLKGKSRAGVLEIGKTFKEAAEHFMKECEVLTGVQRNPRYIEGHRTRLKCHVLPFFGTRPLRSITESVIDDFRLDRMAPKETEDGIVRASPASLDKDITTVRMVLNSAKRRGWIAHVPDMRSQFRASPKKGHRAWFSPEEYKQLYTATRELAKNSGTGRTRERAEELHDFVLFMANTGLRPDEAKNLQSQDVAIETDAATGERILAIEVRGKTGFGRCKSMPGAVAPAKRLRERGKLQDSDPLFSKSVFDRFNDLLDDLGLKVDRDGNRRSAYSLRHSYISFRLSDGADIYQIAKNCRTSVQLIESNYGVHIKKHINTSETNKRSPKPKKKRGEEKSLTE